MALGKMSSWLMEVVDRARSTFPILSAVLDDRRGVAAVEMTILLSTIGIGFASIGYSIGPAVKDYADRLSAVVAEARCLAAVPPADPMPVCPPPAP